MSSGNPKSFAGDGGCGHAVSVGACPLSVFRMRARARPKTSAAPTAIAALARRRPPDKSLGWGRHGQVADTQTPADLYDSDQSNEE